MRWCGGGAPGDAVVEEGVGCGREKEEDERIKRERKRKGDEVQGPICKRKGPNREVEGSEQKKKEKEEGGCKRQGVGTEKDQGDPRGNPRVWRLGGRGPVWATLSLSQIIFLLQI